ncbi:two-component sensor histidine kinase [Streptomyces chrestomyceticus JCM 4735]|uniref:histidine kinase n=2 Tax=Streptomyces chrestomyceticus TaxID=68185 RepID=A0A7U9KS39_9ACTN|nr:two-component sensor histidine kinase [Streptomyces chrestomyceticus JCM 4735]
MPGTPPLRKMRSLGPMDNQEHPDSGASGRRRSRWIAAAVALVLAPAVAAPPSAWTVAVMAALALAVAMLAWPAGRLDRAAGGIAVLSPVADAAYFGPPGLVLLWFPVEAAALLVLLYRVVRHVPPPRAAVAGALTGAAFLALPLRFTLHAPQTGLKESVFVVALALFPAAAATGVGLYLRSLDNRRARAVALARREQRLEVARDLHDFVAHEVTGIVLEAQAGQLEADGSGPEEHRALLLRIEQAGLRALDSMDQTVQALREADGRKWDEPPPTRLYGLADLPELVGRFSSMAASEVDLSLEDDIAGTLAREAEDTAYRVVLEALTNIRRHAPQAARVEVFAGRTADRAVEIAVADDAGPSAPAPTRHGGGTGLAGLAERVSALGGTLEAGPHEKGWRVRCVLPAPAMR